MSQIDSLELKLTSDVGEAVSGINQITACLANLKQAISNGLNLSPIAEGIRDIVQSVNGLDTEKFTVFTKNINDLANIKGLKDVVDATKNFNDTNKKVVDSANEAANAIDNESDSMDDLSDRTKEASKFLNNMKQSNEAYKTTMGTVSGLYSAVYNAYSKVKDVFSDVISTSSEATEAMNRVNVSLGENAHDAYAYAQEVSKATGIYMEEWLNYQARFNTLLNGYGISTETAYKMSKQLTQLGYDLSSYWDIDVDTAFAKLTSTMSGQLQTSKQWGYALEEATLQELAASKGITKRIDAMAMGEKTMLRYYAIMTQSTEAQQDFARTMTNVNNQIKILKSNIQTMAKTIGDIIAPLLNKILPVLIAIVRVITSIFQIFGKIAGVKFKEPDWNASSKGIGSVADGLDDATKSAKEYKRQLLGIDELNVLNGPTGSSSGSGAGIGGDIGSMFDIDFLSYDFLKDANLKTIDNIVEKMKEWLGLNQEINSWTDLLHTKFGEILISVGLISSALALWKIGNGIFTNLSNLERLFADSTLAQGFGQLAGWGLAFTGFAMAIINGIDEVSAALMIFGAGLIGFATAGALGLFWGLVIGGAVSLVIGLIQKKDETIAMLSNLWNWIDNLGDKILYGIGWFIGQVLYNFVTFTSNLWNTLLTFFTTADWGSLGTNVVEGIWEGVKSLWEWLKGKFKSFVDGIIKAFTEPLGIRSPSTVFAGFGRNIVQGLINGIQNMFGSVWNVIHNLGTSVISWFKGILGIHSPSRVFAQLGSYTVEGYNQGFEKEADSTSVMVKDWANSISSVSPTIGVDMDKDLSKLYKGENITDSVRGSLDMNMTDLGTTLGEFYHNYLEGTLMQIASDVHNQANGSNNGDVKVTVTLDGREVGKSVVDYHNDVVKRTGESPLLI